MKEKLKKGLDGSLGQTDFHILAGLKKGPAHGYELMLRVEDMSQGMFRFSTGNLYVALRSLSAGDFIQLLNNEVGKGETTPVDALGVDIRRKTYRITDKGELVLERDVQRLRRMITVYENL